MTDVRTLFVATLLALPLTQPVLAHGTEDHGPLVMGGDLSTEHLLLPDIPVTDAQGQTQGFMSRYGEAGPVLISFLYTECDDTCGMIRGVLQLVDDELQQPGAPPLTLISISVDPWNDTPEVLAEQAKQMHASEKWNWVVASRDDTPALLSGFGLQTGPIEAHEAVYLLGDLSTGAFLRISGVPDPEMLVQRARDIAPGT